MKRITFSIAILLFTFSSSLLSSQTLSPKISFTKLEHDFGSIKEEDGKVQASFVFKNLGNKPLMIKNVASSCGCTTPHYPNQPILPGKSDEIKAEFDPRNRPGNFLKHITIYTNASNQPIVLTIKGNVQKKAPTIADKYPYEFDELRLNKSHVSFLKMDKSEQKDNIVNVINTSTSKPIALEFTNIPKQITITSEPKTLNPGQTGQIHIHYDASKVDDWGFTISSIFLKQNGKTNYRHKLSVSVTIEENFAKLSKAELEKAPKIVFDQTTFNFGTVTKGSKLDHEFAFTNTGKSNLIIRKVKASCGCTAITPQKTIVAPGEKSSIKMVFNSAGKSGRQYKTITVITNSPENTTSVLKIIGSVN